MVHRLFSKAVKFSRSVFYPTRRGYRDDDTVHVHPNTGEVSSVQTRTVQESEQAQPRGVPRRAALLRGRELVLLCQLGPCSSNL